MALRATHGVARVAKVAAPATWLLIFRRLHGLRSSDGIVTHSAKDSSIDRLYWLRISLLRELGAISVGKGSQRRFSWAIVRIAAVAMSQARLPAAERGIHANDILCIFLRLQLFKHSFDLRLLLVDYVLLLLKLAVDAGSIVCEAQKARTADGAEAAAAERKNANYENVGTIVEEIGNHPLFLVGIGLVWLL